MCFEEPNFLFGKKKGLLMISNTGLLSPEGEKKKKFLFESSRKKNILLKKGKELSLPKNNCLSV